VLVSHLLNCVVRIRVEHCASCSECASVFKYYRLRDRTLPPWLNWILRSSGLLRGVKVVSDWRFGSTCRSRFQGSSCPRRMTLEYGTFRLSRSVGSRPRLRRVITHNTMSFIAKRHEIVK
jgi:hypothetical protein